MGILDEAIREHLELKRRLGADSAEVERLEKEAFGAGEPEPAAGAEPAPDAERQAEPVAHVDPEPVPPEPPPAAHEPPAIDQPTRQFTVQELEEAAAADAPETATGDGEHDELEETPDFLQETPEHDRLWFEQKPPKDFDF